MSGIIEGKIIYMYDKGECRMATPGGLREFKERYA